MPEAIGHFKILEPLGGGGLGDVYRARDTRLGRTVALKVIPPSISQDPARLDALHDAAVRLTQLSHPNIAMLFEGGQDGDYRYLVFEYVQGEPLASLINGRPVNVRRALEFAINLADALADAHAAGFVHGDIRPETVMITPKDRAKFMNFGLSQFTAGGAARATAAAAYVSPEELAGQPAESRSDIYSLGAVLFEMLTGRKRARGVVLSNLNPNIPAELEQIVARMLAANIDTRAQSAAAVAAELRSIAAILDTRTEAEEAAAFAAAGRPAERERRGAMIVLLILLALAGALAVWMYTHAG
jgi:serine/threonine-protein kinase